MSVEDQTIPRLTRERDEARGTGDVLANALAIFINTAEIDENISLPLKKMLYAYMKEEALVDRKIFMEMSALENE